jgi:putative ABC transport system ATP-binding protein
VRRMIVATRPAAACYQVVKVYRIGRAGTMALDGVTKEFPPARLTVVAGPSGCGKSTMLRLLACVDRPTSGAVTLQGHSIADATKRSRRRLRRRNIGYLFPDPIENLVEYLTAAEQVRLAAALRGERIRDDEIAVIFERFGLAHRLEHRPREMSGGEQQRTSIACALVGRPALVVADEPTAEVDSVAADRILDGVRVLCDEGTAFVIASHDPRVIERADHVLRLDHGRVVESW